MVAGRLRKRMADDVQLQAKMEKIIGAFKVSNSQACKRGGHA